MSTFSEIVNISVSLHRVCWLITQDKLSCILVGHLD